MKDPTRWIVNTVDDLPTYVSNRVVIIGDAVGPLVSRRPIGFAKQWL